MQVIHERCAGLDVHKKQVVACIRLQDGASIEHQVRSFETTTSALFELASWLAENHVRYAVMEATGVYWKPVWHILAEEFELMLANAQHVKNVPGRKTDEPESICTELIRDDAGLGAAPTIFGVGCFGTYTQLQFTGDGTLYLLAASGSGAQVRLGRSDDQGETWSFQDVVIQGLPPNGDVRYFGMTPIKPYTSPDIYDPDQWVFLFSGADSAGLARHSYLGLLELPYGPVRVCCGWGFRKRE